MAESQYRIVSAQLPLIGGVAGHNFLALIGPDGNVIGEFHGLATGPDGNPKPIGHLPSDELKGYDDRHYYEPNFAQTELASGDQAEMMKRWNAGKAALDKMNARNIHHPWMGLGQNSNSFASTLIAVMGLTVPPMPGGAPVMAGARSMLLDAKDIQGIQRQFNIDLPRSEDTSNTGLQPDGVDQPNALDAARWPPGPDVAPSDLTTPPRVGNRRSAIAPPQDLRGMPVPRAEGATSLGGPNGPASLVPPMRSRIQALASPAPSADPTLPPRHFAPEAPRSLDPFAVPGQLRSDPSGGTGVGSGTNPPSLLTPSFAASRMSPDATPPAVLRGAGPMGDGYGIGDWWRSLASVPSSDAALDSVRRPSSFIRGTAETDPSSSVPSSRSAALTGAASRRAVLRGPCARTARTA